MPMYNFACEECGKRFEEIVAYNRRHEVKCPDCQGATRVLISGFAVKSGGTGAAVAAKPAGSPFS
ncbi:MAG TPA: zinc ribbon domain-containing protein [Symbiobacteriaceae bacterium]|nr:zinc ribbon domain-containing protein [Symbiobacteriaceae bacterium]